MCRVIQCIPSFSNKLNLTQKTRQPNKMLQVPEEKEKEIVRINRDLIKNDLEVINHFFLIVKSISNIIWHTATVQNYLTSAFR